MKKLFGLLLLCPSLSLGADLTAGVNTYGNQLYNKNYRDVKDGTNAETVDAVSANTYAIVATTTVIKASGGYLDNIQLWSTCANTYILADTATSLGSALGYTTVISTIPASYAAINIPLHVRFSNGLTFVSPASSTCTVTVSYR